MNTTPNTEQWHEAGFHIVSDSGKPYKQEVERYAFLIETDEVYNDNWTHEHELNHARKSWLVQNNGYVPININREELLSSGGFILPTERLSGTWNAFDKADDERPDPGYLSAQQNRERIAAWVEPQDRPQEAPEPEEVPDIEYPDIDWGKPATPAPVPTFDDIPF